jgi:DNA-binding CsgD family transcriptional regulator
MNGRRAAATTAVSGRSMMLAAGRSQRETALTLGVSQTTVRNWSAASGDLARAA